MSLGQVVVLNGAPRSGKTTIARQLIDVMDGDWVNLDVDAVQAATSERLTARHGTEARSRTAGPRAVCCRGV